MFLVLIFLSFHLLHKFQFHIVASAARLPSATEERLQVQLLKSK